MKYKITSCYSEEMMFLNRCSTEVCVRVYRLLLYCWSMAWDSGSLLWWQCFNWRPRV